MEQPLKRVRRINDRRLHRNNHLPRRVKAAMKKSLLKKLFRVDLASHNVKVKGYQLSTNKWRITEFGVTGRKKVEWPTAKLYDLFRGITRKDTLVKVHS